MKRHLIGLGLEEATDPADSNVVLLNTCTVTASADAEVRQVIRKVHRRNPSCSIVVTGCYAQRAPEEIAQLPGVRWVVGNSHKHRIGDLLSRSPDERDRSSISSKTAKNPAPALIQISPSESRAAAGNPAAVAEPRILVGEIGDEFHFQPVFLEDRTRPTLKIQDGCNARCSFCVIPFVRGRSRSLDPHAVIAQVLNLERVGFQEVVLSGINLGRYGRDLSGGVTFYGLLGRILEQTRIPRIRISSIELMDVSRELIELAACEPRMAQHFHIPLQSGCDRILRLMNRRYWAAQYAERISEIRERIPAAGIGADVMAGFPGETDRNHQESLHFIESLPFTYLHIFPYSPRPGTRALSIAGAIDGRRAHDRCKEIRNMIETKRRRFMMSQIGKKLSVVTLHEVADGVRLAVASNFLKATVPVHIPENVLTDALAERLEGDTLRCRAPLNDPGDSTPPLRHRDSESGSKSMWEAIPPLSGAAGCA